MPCSVINASPKAGGGGGGGGDDEVLMRHRLQFSDSLKDLKNLRKQLYSAAEYFESSYSRDNHHKQLVVESSKDYVTKALVNTVDHLGSVADKLNKFMDQNANQLSTTNAQFSSIQRRLCTAKGLVESRCLSQHLFHTKDTANLKHTILRVPATETLPLALGNSNVLFGKRFSSLPGDVIQPKQEKSFFEVGRMKADRVTRREASTSPFSFTSKEGRRSVSPLALRFNLTTKRSVSPSPSLNKGQRPTEPRRSISACRGREMRNGREMEMESYTKKSKHLLKALLSLHHSRKTNSTHG